MKKADKLAITALWQRLIPSVSVMHPLLLAKRHGPLLVGICLDETRDPAIYRPTCFIHNLAAPFPVLTLKLAGYWLNSKGAVLTLKVADEASATAAARDLAERFPFVASANMTLNDYLGRTKSYLQDRPRIGEDAPFSDAALVAMYVGLADYARETVERGASVLATWPVSALRGETVQSWRDRLTRACGSDLHAVAASEADRHGVSTLPDLGLPHDDPPIPVW